MRWVNRPKMVVSSALRRDTRSRATQSGTTQGPPPPVIITAAAVDEKSTNTLPPSLLPSYGGRQDSTTTSTTCDSTMSGTGSRSRIAMRRGSVPSASIFPTGVVGATPAVREKSIAVKAHCSTAAGRTEEIRRLAPAESTKQLFDRLKGEGIEILMLNRENNQWQPHFLTITDEVMAFKNSSNCGGIDSCPMGLLWVKKFDHEKKHHTLASIGKNDGGKGGILFNSIDAIIMGNVDVSVQYDSNSSIRRQKKGEFSTDNTTTLALYSSNNGSKSEILFRCTSKEDALTLSSSFQTMLDCLRLEGLTTNERIRGRQHGDVHIMATITPDGVAGNSTAPRGRTSRSVSYPSGEKHESALTIPANFIQNLHWRDNPANGELHGLYSGPINDLLQPHGEGILILGGNSFLKFYGHWVYGELVTYPGITQRLLNEDEKKEYDRSVRSSRIFGTENEDVIPLHQVAFGKKISTEYMHTPSASSVGSESSISNSGDFQPPSPAKYVGTRTTFKSTASSRQQPPKQVYRLGEVARTPSHMVIHRSNERAIQSVTMLKKFDQAFIKRSNGLWTCSIFVERALQPTNAYYWHTEDEINEATMELEESMLFIIDEDGATKIVRRKHFAAYIRRMR